MKSLFKPINTEEENEHGRLLTTNFFFAKMMKRSPSNSPERGIFKFKSNIFKRESSNTGPQSDRLRTMNNEMTPLRNRLGSTKFNFFKLAKSIFALKL